MFTQYNTFQQQQPLVNDMSSPSVCTPYLDSSIDTPFLDNNSADTPPFFDMSSDISPYLMYASFGVPSFQQYNNEYGVSNIDINNKDVCIARYLEGHEPNEIAKLTHDPIKFNGDPSLLIIDKTKSPFMSSYQVPPTKAETKPSPTVKLETVTEEESDSLFPPLNSSQQSINTYESKFEKDTMSLDELLGFDATSPLSDSVDEEEEDQVKDEEAQPSSQQAQTQTKESTPIKQEAEQTTSKKRKSSTAATSETVKRKKTTTTTKKVTKTTTKPKEVKLYQCPLCDHASKRRYNLSTHIKTHDKSRIKEFDCTQCTKSFDRRHDRDRHLATVHRGERVFNCSHCGSHFSRRDALNRHLIQRHDYDESDFAE